MLHRRGVVLSCMGLTGFGVARPAAAQTWPTRTVTIVVPFAPGGLIDILARLLADQLRQTLGQPVVVENRSGAGGIPGARTVATAAPDGYTLLLANTNLAINPWLYRQLPYDTAMAFAPIILAYTVPNIIVVHPSVPARNLAELIALAKAEPGRLNYASPTTGTFPHLAMVLLLHQAGVRMTHVPYNGLPPALTALLTGQVQVMSNDPPGVLPHIASGALRAIAVTSRTRLPSLPDVPTLDEAGLSGFEAVGWQGVAAPAGTPEAVIRRLHDALAAALAVPEVRARLSSQGVNFVVSSPEEFRDFFGRELERWRGAVAAAGAVAD